MTIDTTNMCSPSSSYPPCRSATLSCVLCPDSYVLNLPLIVGEFGYNYDNGNNNLKCKTDHRTIMKTCKQLGYGFMPWSWTGNNKENAWLDIVDHRDWKTPTQWGNEVIDGENGIRQTAVTANVFAEDCK